MYLLYYITNTYCFLWFIGANIEFSFRFVVGMVLYSFILIVTFAKAHKMGITRGKTLYKNLVNSWKQN